MSTRSLHGLRALVTGSSSGIGRSLAIQLAAAGVRCVLVARSEQKLREVGEACRDAGCEAIVVAGDITDPEARKRALQAAEAAWGGLDLLINNAGVSAYGEFCTQQPATMRQVFEVNFFAATELTCEAMPLLAVGTTPAVVNIGSILGHQATPFNATYCASKFALHGWSQSLRAELSTRQIDLIVVAPGTTETGFRDHAVENRITVPWASRKGDSPEAVARAAVKAIRNNRREVIPSFAGWWLVLASRLAPGLVAWGMNRTAMQAVQANRQAQEHTGTENTP